MNKRLKNILVGLGVILVLLQFVQPTLNQGTVEGAEDVSKAVEVPAEVSQILQKSCNDCHSNATVYPWYTNIQPIGMWMQHHVDEGKQELNFSTFNLYSAKRKAHKMEEIVEMVETDEMPLKSYTLVHRNAVLTESEKAILMAWAKKSYATLKIAP
jgi:hypothetical protein